MPPKLKHSVFDVPKVKIGVVLALLIPTSICCQKVAFPQTAAKIPTQNLVTGAVPVLKTSSSWTQLASEGMRLHAEGKENEAVQYLDAAVKTYEDGLRNGSIRHADNHKAARVMNNAISIHGRQIMLSDQGPSLSTAADAENRLTEQKHHMSQIQLLRQKLKLISPQTVANTDIVVNKTAAVIGNTAKRLAQLKSSAK